MKFAFAEKTREGDPDFQDKMDVQKVCLGGFWLLTFIYPGEILLLLLHTYIGNFNLRPADEPLQVCLASEGAPFKIADESKPSACGRRPDF